MSDKLAIHGGRPAFPKGPPRWPVPDPQVHEALERAYADGSWGVYDGPNCQAFKTELAEFHKLPYAKLCCSGTIAVEIALRSVGVQAGDEVVLAAYDFAGNFRAIESIGAIPVLVDIDRDTWSMSPAQLADAAGRNTKAILASHLHGGIAPIQQICEFATERGIAVVEDACQAHGASIDGNVAGTTGDAGVLSFGGSKLMTSGRGGAVVTSSELVYQRALVFCGQGNDAFAMSELQAAVLRPQLTKLNQRNTIRSANARSLVESLKDCDELQTIRLPSDGDKASYFKLPWLLSETTLNAIPLDRDLLLRALEAEGLAIGPGFRGFVKRSSRRCRKPVALESASAAIERTVLLHHPVLLRPPEDVERVARTWQRVLSAFRDGSLSTSVIC